MKKTLSILLVAVLAISSVIGVSAATRFISNDTGATFDQIQTSVFASKKTNEFPDVTGTWKHDSNDGCSIQVVNQNDNHVDITIQSQNEKATKIATSRLSLDLEKDTFEGEIRGTAYFNYSDSFGSGGRGSIIVKEDSISLAIVKEYDPCAAWNITAAAGDYHFESKKVDPNEASRFDNLPENQQIFDHTVSCPELEGLWVSTTNEGASIRISNQDDCNADVTVELHNRDLTKISTAKFPITFYTEYNGDHIGAVGAFEYTDSFGGSGTGKLIFDGEVMRLEINEEVTGVYPITPAAGVFTMSDSTPTTVVVEDTTDNELTLPDVTGTWKHGNNINGCSVQIFNQDGNKIDFMIESTNEDATKIATAKVSVELDLWHDGSVVRGESNFEVTDSFGNSGKGRISVSENVVTIILDDFTNVSSWGIGNTSGNYFFASNAVNPTL